MTAGQFASAAANYKKTRGIASDNHRNEYIGMFEIRKNSTNNMWYLKVNEDRLIGTKYSSKNEALAVLHGLFSGMNAKTDGMNAIITRMINQGRGIIEAETAAALVDDAIIWFAMKEATATDDTGGAGGVGGVPQNQMTLRTLTTTTADQVAWFRDGKTVAQSFIGGADGLNGWAKMDNTAQNYFEGNGAHGVKLSCDMNSTTDGGNARDEWEATSTGNQVLILKELTGGDVTEWDFSDADFSSSNPSDGATPEKLRFDLSTNSTQATAINNYLASKWTGSGSWYIQLGKNQF